MITYPASQRQLDFLRSLREEIARLKNTQVAPEAQVTGDALARWIDTSDVAGDKASCSAKIEHAITWRDRLRKEVKTTSVVVEHAPDLPQVIHEGLAQGVYEVGDEVFIVKSNKEHTRLYAKKLVEIAGDRLTEADTVVQVEFEYAPGAIYRILPEHKMSVEQGKALTVRYGRCICCGRKLKAAKSVEKGIGPVCITYFAA